MQRILLLELLTSDRIAQERSATFPFVRGYAEARGMSVRWLSFGYDPAALPPRERVVPLSREDVARLGTIARTFRPTHVLTNEVTSGAVARAIAAAAPDARIDTYGLRGGPSFPTLGDLAAWLGTEERDAAQPLFRATPSHACELANELAKQVRPFLQVLCGPICSYARPVAANPAYAGLDLSRARRRAGCAFCLPPSFERALPPLSARELVDRVMAQLRRARETMPEARRSGDVLLTSAAALLHVGPLLDAVLSADLPPLRLHFFCRADELVRRSAEIEARLGALREAGHSVHPFAMGVENFSPPENERLNKGLSPVDVERAVATLTRWEREAPGTVGFREHGGFSYILFTPWTTLDDLRTNIEAASRLGLPATYSFLASRLQLVADTPVTLLAERDGLLSEAFPDPASAAFDAGCLKDPDTRELPWRFRHAAVAAVYGAVARMWPRPGVPDDALRGRVEALLADAPDRLSFVRALVESARGEPAARSTEELLERLAARPPAGGATVAPWARGVLERVVAHPRCLLRGFGIERVEAEAPRDRLRELTVTLARGDERMALTLFPRETGRPFFGAGERLAFVHAPDTPLGSPERQRVAGVVLRAIERCLRTAPVPLATDPAPLESPRGD